MAPEEREKWIEETANAAWLAAENAAACRFLLGNLVVALHEAGVVDGLALTHRLRDRANDLEDHRTRRAATDLLEELLLLLSPSEGTDEVH